MGDLFANKGTRLASNRVKVSIQKNGQAKVTIPRFMARSMQLEKGSVMEFELLQSGGVKLRKVLE